MALCAFKRSGAFCLFQTKRLLSELARQCDGSPPGSVIGEKVLTNASDDARAVWSRNRGSSYQMTVFFASLTSLGAVTYQRATATWAVFQLGEKISLAAVIRCQRNSEGSATRIALAWPFGLCMTSVRPTLVEIDIDAVTADALDHLAGLKRDDPAMVPADQRRAMNSWVHSRLEHLGMTREHDSRTSTAKLLLTACFQSTKLLDVWRAHPKATNLSVLGAAPARLEHGDGRIETLPPVVDSDEELRRNIIGMAASIGSYAGEIWDPARPEFEIILEDGTRVTAVDWISQRPFVTLRRATYSAVTLDDLVINRTLTSECAEFLAAAVQSGLRILVSGSMNSGKTVLLRALASALRKTDAVMVAESQPELRLEHADAYPDFVVSLSARRSRSNERYDVTVRSLVERIQRMTPSVVIVGEVRGEESVALAAALGQGYPVMSTIHADSARAAVANAAMYYEEAIGTTRDAALLRLATGVDLSIYLGRDETNQRVVAEVMAIDIAGHELTGEMLFRYEPGGLARTSKSIPPDWQRRLRNSGYESK